MASRWRVFNFRFQDFGFEMGFCPISQFPSFRIPLLLSLSTFYFLGAAYGPTSGLSCVSFRFPSSAATPRAIAAVSLPAWKQVKWGRSSEATGPHYGFLSV